MPSKNWNIEVNTYSSFCKLGFKKLDEVKKLSKVTITSSNGNIVKKPYLGIISFMVIFFLSFNLPLKVKFKKPSSFFRSRHLHFWGYKNSLGGIKFDIFSTNFKENLIAKSFFYGFSSRTSFFFGRKRNVGIPSISFLDEFSETNFFKLKFDFGINFFFFFKKKNYINFIPLK